MTLPWVRSHERGNRSSSRFACAGGAWLCGVLALGSGCGSSGSSDGTGGAASVGGTASGGTNDGTGGAASGGASSGGAASGGTMNGSGGGTTGGTTGDPERTEIVRATFDDATVGTYEESDVEADFGVTPAWNNGLDAGRAAIVEEGADKFLRVTYPANQFGPSNGGVQFQIPFGQSYDELFFAYRVRFAAGFDFVKGGKLPGLVGGTSPTGCAPNPDGFSARNMWRTGGALVQYVYYPTQPNDCGDDLNYQSGGTSLLATPGTWHTIEHRIVMNTPGTADGVLEAWVDGELVYQASNRLWRNTGATFGIDTLYFSTFFGGGDASWAPSAAQVVDFDDLIVADGAITHAP